MKGGVLDRTFLVTLYILRHGSKNIERKGDFHFMSKMIKQNKMMGPDSIKPGLQIDILDDDPQDMPPDLLDGLYVIVGVNLYQFAFLLVVLDEVVDGVGRHLLVPEEAHAFLGEASHLRNEALSDLVGDTINFDLSVVPGFNHNLGNPRIEAVESLHEAGYAALLEFFPNLPFFFPGLRFSPWLSSNPFSQHSDILPR